MWIWYNYNFILITEKIGDFFLNNNENSNIIDQNKRKETLIRMIRRKGELYEDCGRVQNIKEESNKNSRLANSSEDQLQRLNDKNIDILNQKRKREKVIYEPEIETKVRVVEYLYTHEKKNLNRNTILRIPFQNGTQGFENLLSLCNKFFTKNNTNKATSETLTFLEELTMEYDDFQQNKAIIIVPSTFLPGNICIDNAKKFLLDAQ